MKKYSRCSPSRRISMSNLTPRRPSSSENEEQKSRKSGQKHVSYSRRYLGKKYFSHSVSKPIKTGEKTKKLSIKYFQRDKMSYDNFAHTFSQSRKNHPWPELDFIISDIRDHGYMSVLDVGCGNARFIQEWESGIKNEK